MCLGFRSFRGFRDLDGGFRSFGLRGFRILAFRFRVLCFGFGGDGVALWVDTAVCFKASPKPLNPNP